jgi:hypothetical protein
LLAKNANDDAGLLDARGALGFLASKLAPTVTHEKARSDGGLFSKQVTGLR